MSEMLLIYVGHWIFAIAALLISWNRAKHVLHPHFIFTMMLVVLVSDFLVRGYNVNNDPDLTRQRLDHILEADVFRYQGLILFALSTIVFVSLFVRDRFRERMVSLVSVTVRPARRVQTVFVWAAFVLLGAEGAKRLMTSGWSLSAVLAQSLAERGHRAWDEAAFVQGNFIFAIITILLPLATLVAMYIVICGRGPQRFLSVALASVGLLALVTDGSRTPVAIVVGASWFLAMLQYRTILARAIWSAGSVFGLAVLMSVMIRNRAAGYMGGDAQPGIVIVYHQDDSYYRAINAYQYAEASTFRWDASEFFYTLAVNPIPRAIWPNKPLIDEWFYGDFKLWWTTMSFFGEAAAMFGVAGGTAFSIFYALFLYVVLYSALRVVSKPLGVVAYLIVALYCYQCIRSIMSVTQFMYLPIAAVLLVQLATRFGRRRVRSLAQPG